MVPALQVIDAAPGIGERVDRFLAHTLTDVSRTRIQHWLKLGGIWCETRAISAKTRLLGNERLFVRPLPLEADQSFVADPVDVCVVEANPHYFVISKPAGLVVHPAAGNWRNTLLNGLLFHWPEQAELPRAGIVHRLDKDTSGLMVVARSERARQSFIEQLRDRSMSRRYLALAQGRLLQQTEVDAPIGRHPAQRTRMAVVDRGTGKPAQTEFRPLAWGRLGARDLTLLECRLRSGRTHQIRVHLSHRGMPLLGDALYGGDASVFPRQALHAFRLGFIDPGDQRPRHWRLPPPADLLAMLDTCGIGQQIIDQVAADAD